jgi:hypothetical protein
VGELHAGHSLHGPPSRTFGTITAMRTLARRLPLPPLRLPVRKHWSR